MTKKKSRFFERAERAARAEILDTQQEGYFLILKLFLNKILRYIEPDDGVPTCFIKQTGICDAVDIASATKVFFSVFYFPFISGFCGTFLLHLRTNSRFSFELLWFYPQINFSTYLSKKLFHEIFLKYF